MSAHVLLNLLNELGEKIRCEALPSILSVFPNELTKFNYTETRRLICELIAWAHIRRPSVNIFKRLLL